MLSFLLILGCVHNAQIASPPTDGAATSPSEMVATDPKAFAEWARGRHSLGRRTSPLGEAERSSLASECSTYYADPSQMAFGICEMVSACQSEAPDPRLDCSCVRCERLLGGQIDLYGCDAVSKSRDVSGACEEPDN